MAEKKTYYVTVDTQDIREMSLPENGVEYEIYATPKEVEEIKMLFNGKDQNEKDASKYIVCKPFDEWGADDERNNYDDHVITIYRKLYQFGAKKTKDKIDELGLF